MKKTDIKYAISVGSFLVAVAFGIAGFCVDPRGEVSDSVLYLIAQFMVLTASILGVSAVFKDNIEKMKEVKNV